jgi:hypothetical protein|nr:MAG TPA: 30S ribosomal protein S3 [Caudoviricetes sp.]
MSGKYSKRFYSSLICKECGLRMTIPRRRNQIRPEGHIKTMYCGMCGKITDFVENNNRSMADAEKGE